MAGSKPEGPSLMASLGRVLVVEDEPQVALMLHDALQDFGYEVRVAINGHEALWLVADYQPSVVLLDLWLPGLPGESVLEAVRREAPTVPIIIVSGNRDADRARALLLRGAFDYVAKPFELTVLERAMAAAVIEHARRGAA
jgi:DNA-binding NtrC family response regulator